jgi:hypothetical protein
LRLLKLFWQCCKSLENCPTFSSRGFKGKFLATDNILLKFIIFLSEIGSIHIFIRYYHLCLLIRMFSTSCNFDMLICVFYLSLSLHFFLFFSPTVEILTNFYGFILSPFLPIVYNSSLCYLVVALGIHYSIWIYHNLS